MGALSGVSGGSARGRIRLSNRLRWGLLGRIFGEGGFHHFGVAFGLLRSGLGRCNGVADLFSGGCCWGVRNDIPAWGRLVSWWCGELHLSRVGCGWCGRHCCGAGVRKLHLRRVESGGAGLGLGWRQELLVEQ